MQKREEEPDTIGIISNIHTLILRQGYLEIYDTSQKAWDQCPTPDVLFTPGEVKELQSLLQEWIVPEN